MQNNNIINIYIYKYTVTFWKNKRTQKSFFFNVFYVKNTSSWVNFRHGFGINFEAESVQRNPNYTNNLAQTALRRMLTVDHVYISRWCNLYMSRQFTYVYRYM